MSERTANGVDCTFCGVTSEVEEFEVDAFADNIPDCPECGEFPIAVFIEPCPNGITVDDWVPGVGMKTGRVCPSDVHEPKSGNHVTEIPS